MDMTAVAVIGTSGRVGGLLERVLAADRAVTRVVRLDSRSPRTGSPKLELRPVGAAPDLKPLLDGIDVIVHLTSPFAHAPEGPYVDVEGARRLLDAAGGTSPRQVVHVSTAAAYGAWPDNPVPLTEDAPLRPNPGFEFAVRQAETERTVYEWAESHPATVTTVLRPVFVPGSSTRGVPLRGRLALRIRDAAPPVQYVHVDDLVSALKHAVDHDLAGTYNVAPDGWLAWEDAAALGRRTPGLPLPFDMADRVLGARWSAGLTDLPSGITPYLAHPWVVANDRLKATGWAPAHTCEEAIVAGAGREDTGTWRRAAAAAVATGLGGAVAGLVWRMRRPRR